MSYIITKTDGTILQTPNLVNGTLLDGTIDTTIGLSLIGRNYPNYSQAQNENFVRLLENFADNIPPTQSILALNALVGTIWYDTSIKKIRVYDGINWNPASSTIVSNATPTSTNYTISVGDQWWDTVNNQLNSWTGNTWQLVGPDPTIIPQLESELASNVSTLNDTINQLRSDTGTYMTANVSTLNGTINQLRTDTGTYMTANVATINNTINQLRTDTNQSINANVTVLNNSINQLRTDTGNYMTANVSTLNNTILSNYTTLSNQLSLLNTEVDQGFSLTNSNVTNNTSAIGAINSTLPSLAPLNSPALTGNPTAPTQPANNNSTLIATTAYVDSSALVLSTDYNNKFSNEVVARTSAIAAAVSGLAPINSPTFTGTPNSPTPMAGDISTKVATTAFVSQAVAASVMNYTVSTNPPSGGNNGDFWFQI
jgi:outer membrane murein-binding lipoprotein Lpp